MRSSAAPRLRNKMTTALVRNTIRKETCRTLLKGSHEPFPYQLDAAVAVATGRDTVLITPTGAGNTLVLAMPLLYHKTKVSIVISPLQALETDQALKMNQLGIKSILVDSVDLRKRMFRSVTVFYVLLSLSIYMDLSLSLSPSLSILLGLFCSSDIFILEDTRSCKRVKMLGKCRCKRSPALDAVQPSNDA